MSRKQTSPKCSSIVEHNTSHNGDARLRRLRDHALYASRLPSLPLSPTLPLERGPWFESEEEKETGFARARIRARQMRIVRRAVDRLLTPKQARRFRACYLKAVPQCEVARAEHLARSTLSRSLTRAVARLKKSLAP